MSTPRVTAREVIDKISDAARFEVVTLPAHDLWHDAGELLEAYVGQRVAQAIGEFERRLRESVARAATTEDDG